MKLAPELVSLINAGGLWLFIEFIKMVVRELRRETAHRVEGERVIRGTARILAEEERRSGEPEIVYGQRIGARTGLS